MTAAAWPALRVAYGWVHQAAHLLANSAGQDGASVRQAYQALLHTMTQQQELAGPLAPAVAHFHKVTASYWPGLFHCYDVPDLPHTNNDLEQYFGTARHLAAIWSGGPPGARAPRRPWWYAARSVSSPR